MMVSLKYQDMKREGREEGREEGLEEGREEGREEGGDFLLINLIHRKMQKNQSVSQIAEDLVEDESKVKAIYDVIQKSSGEFNAEEIYMNLTASRVK